MTGMPPIAVLAGGFATRMRPLTAELPKAPLEVAGEPFIAHQLRLFAREGLRDIKLLVGYCRDQIEFFVGGSSRFGIKVATLLAGKKIARGYYILYESGYFAIPDCKYHHGQNIYIEEK
jgi:NDP-sugar pyrophosphorylase family protein